MCFQHQCFSCKSLWIKTKWMNVDVNHCMTNNASKVSYKGFNTQTYQILLIVKDKRMSFKSVRVCAVHLGPDRLHIRVFAAHGESECGKFNRSVKYWHKLSTLDELIQLKGIKWTQSVYSSRHLLLFLPFLACSAALVAISNTSRTPSLVLAEHSMYPKAQMRLAMSRPSSGLTGSCGTERDAKTLWATVCLNRNHTSSRIGCFRTDRWTCIYIQATKTLFRV